MYASKRTGSALNYIQEPLSEEIGFRLQDILEVKRNLEQRGQAKLSVNSRDRHKQIKYQNGRCKYTM
jgi:hypothetical protein